MPQGQSGVSKTVKASHLGQPWTPEVDITPASSVPSKEKAVRWSVSWRQDPEVTGATEARNTGKQEPALAGFRGGSTHRVGFASPCSRRRSSTWHPYPASRRHQHMPSCPPQNLCAPCKLDTFILFCIVLLDWMAHGMASSTAQLWKGRPLFVLIPQKTITEEKCWKFSIHKYLNSCAMKYNKIGR